MGHPLDGAFAKFDAGLEHFKALTEEAEAFLSREPKPYTEFLEIDVRESHIKVIAEIREQLPPRFSTRVGDIVHNLASALDHAIFQLVLLRAEREIEQTHFPLYGDIRDYRRYRRGKRGAWMGYLTTADRALIQHVQPYRGGDFAFSHPMVQLYRLWNRDKHRTLNVTYAMVSEYGFKLTILRDIESLGQAIARLGGIENETEILRIPFTASGPSPEVNLKTEVALDIGIDNGLKIKNLLASIGDWVQNILDRMAEAFPEGTTYDEWKTAQDGTASPPPVELPE